MKIFVLRIISLFLITAVSFSCSTNNSTQSPKENLTQTTRSPEKYRIVKHAMGTTKIIGKPQRIVVLTNEATDLVLALGIKPVGAVKSWSGDPYFDYIASDMAGVMVIGDEFQPNLEKIVILKPDLIIGSKIRQQQIYRRLAAIAPTVFSETIGVTWKDNLKLYAEALDRQQEAEKITNNWHQRVANFKAKLENRKVPEISLVRFAPGMTRVYYKKSFPGQIIEEVGLKRPETQNKNKFAEELGLESIPDLDADIMFYFTYDSGNNKGKKVELKWLQHPLWKTLKVIQNERAYQVNDVYWTTSGGVQSANKVLDDLYLYILEEQKYSN
ncbi:MAG: iron-siderophore ABC transporter substrate-binding protein [Prochloraceae cyanobacterium]|nr:iron-siderophore ABC transporter substrate-binding protein [Prochloraceae cyanobacterium]